MKPMRVSDDVISLANKLAKIFYVCTVLAGFVIMAALMLVGICEIATGLLLLTPMWREGNPDAEPASAALTKALKGIEFLFLSPIPLLIVPRITRYVLDNLDERKTARASASHKSLAELKGLTTGLLIAVVATDLIAKILSKDGLTYEAAAAESLVIGVLAIYFVVLALCEVHTKREGTSEQKAMAFAIQLSVTRYEWEKLVGLIREGTFDCRFSEELVRELGSLEARGLIRNIGESGGIEQIRQYVKDKQAEFDLKQFVEVTENGRGYAAARIQIERHGCLEA